VIDTSKPPADLPRLPARAADSHKGTFGTVAIIAGHSGSASHMLGAAALAGLAALRSGVGLVKLVMPAPVLDAALTILPSATGIPLAVDHDGDIIPHQAAETLDSVFESASVLAIGPGLGVSEGSRAAVLRVIQQESLPVVIDADALNCIAEMPEVIRDLHALAVLTPHPGEFKRLCAGLGLKNDLGLADSREQACAGLAQRLGRIVALKGAGTVVSDGHRTWTCPSGHPCMATGGTGDVLTGALAGLIAQFSPSVDRMAMRARVPAMPADPARPLDLYDAARVAVWSHGAAGEAWAKSHNTTAGMLASELADNLPQLIESLRERKP
jgi:NAD(P)H-hydrate epimerase